VGEKKKISADVIDRVDDHYPIYLSLQKRGITYYKKHRTAEVGRDICRSSGPTLMLKQGHLELVAQDHVQAAFEFLQRWRHHSLPRQPVPVLGHPLSDKVFPDVQREPPVFQPVPIASGPVPGHH